MPTHGSGAIGSLDYTPEERRALARRFVWFYCVCMKILKCEQNMGISM